MRIRVLFLSCFLCCLFAHGQNGPQLPDVRPYTSVQGSGMENVSQTNGSLNVHIPLWSVKQRGKPKVDYWLAYVPPTYSLDFECDNASHPSAEGCYSHYPMCPPPQTFQLCQANWNVTGGGLYNNVFGIYVASSLDYAVQLRQLYGHLSNGQTTVGPWYWQITDPSGASHRLVKTSGTLWRSADGSDFLYDQSTCLLKDGEGTGYQFACTANSQYGSSPGLLQTITDSNGNQIAYQQGNTAIRTFVDTVGNTISGFNQISVDSSCPAGTATEQKWTPPGITSAVVLCFVNTHYRTNFFNGNGSPDVDDGTNLNQEAVGDITQISHAVLPNGESYHFDYNTADSAHTYNYGELAKLTLPTGGFITYQWWQTTNPICGVLPAGGSEVAGVGTRSVYESANATPAVWTYLTSSGGADYGTGKVTDPYGNVDEITFTSPGVYTSANGCARYPHTVVHKNSSGSVARTVTTEYQWFPSDLVDQDLSVSDPLVLEGLPTSVTTSWPDGATKKTVNVYDSGFSGTSSTGVGVTVPYGKVISTTEYAFGSGSAGTALSTRSTTYKYADNAFLASNHLDAIDSDTLTDVLTGSSRSKTFGYDDANRGNVATSTQHLDTPNSDLQTAFTYTSYGLVNSVALPPDPVTPSTQTTAVYSSSYASAVPTSVKDALNHETTVVYDPASLRATSTTDPNSQTTQYTYYADGRLHQRIFPDGGEHDYSYPSPNEVDEAVRLDANRSIVTKTFFDGLGRKTRTVLQGACPDAGDVTVETTYDLLDRVRSVTNPHCSSGNIATTHYGSPDGTQPGYDSLGRPLLITNPDGTTKTWSYNNRSIDPLQDSVAVTDEAGHTTAQITDALGHQVGVIEPGGLQTSYTMNAFGELTDVNQAGVSGEQARTRHFVYDSLGRLTSSTNPETGTITYTYDNHNNVLSKTEARGAVTSYQYDALNRVTRKLYGGTENAHYTYDGTFPPGIPGVGMSGPSPHQIGRLSYMWAWTPTGASAEDEYFGYDEMGRLKHWGSAFPSEVGFAAHFVDAGYDLAGNLKWTVYPDGLGVTNGYDSAGRLTGVWSSAATYLSGATYNPDGSPATLTYGNGVVETLSKNSRLQTCEDKVALGSTTYLDRQYFFGTNNGNDQRCQATAGNNGNIRSIVDGLGGSYSQSFSYDALNRLTHWTAPNMAGQVRQKYFNYDSFGNMMPGDTAASAASYYSASNRLSTTPNCQGVYGNPAGYDAAGNVTCTGNQNVDATAYVWDVEDRLIHVWGQQNNNTYYPRAVYSYDAEGKRIRSDQFAFSTGNIQSWREYAYFKGQVFAEKDNNWVWTDYIYANGKKIARVEPSKAMWHAHGVRDGSINMGCGTNWWVGNVLGGFGGSYTVKAGDKLVYDQRSVLAQGGIAISFSNGALLAGNVTDGEGYYSNLGSPDGAWHHRVVPLDQFAGAQPSGLISTTEHQTGAGTWDTWIANVEIVSQDGTVTQIFNGQPLASALWSDCGGHDLSFGTDSTPVAGQVATTYYVGDQVGTTQMEITGLGAPVYKGEFAPFGTELDLQATTNRYKFTGKERDAESGLDYFGARYYASSMGRWMSPDWADKPEAVPYSSLDNPQTLNLYGYVRNNPLSKADPDGHCPTCLEAAVEGAEAGAEVGSFFGPVGTAVGAFVGGAAFSGAAWYATNKIVTHMENSQQPAQPVQPQTQEEHQAAPEPQTSTSGAGARQGGNGTIYRVPGSGTKSGKPYIGRHNKADPSRTRKSKDGRDRSQAEVVDTYNASNTAEGRQKEQQQIDANGGVSNLDNKRNEIKPTPQ